MYVEAILIDIEGGKAIPFKIVTGDERNIPCTRGYQKCHFCIGGLKITLLLNGGLKMSLFAEGALEKVIIYRGKVWFCIGG